MTSATAVLGGYCHQSMRAEITTATQLLFNAVEMKVPQPGKLSKILNRRLSRGDYVGACRFASDIFDGAVQTVTTARIRDNIGTIDPTGELATKRADISRAAQMLATGNPQGAIAALTDHDVNAPDLSGNSVEGEVTIESWRA